MSNRADLQDKIASLHRRIETAMLRVYENAAYFVSHPTDVAKEFALNDMRQLQHLTQDLKDAEQELKALEGSEL
ncbi:hypothetical protein [Chroococcidiopsis sp.]|uniref:hypothetical protein n=1 Tax=Chroococcidiopsis sp. TaxID=3088168 RepID=UPI003F3A0E02